MTQHEVTFHRAWANTHWSHAKDIPDEELVAMATGFLFGFIAGVALSGVDRVAANAYVKTLDDDGKVTLMRKMLNGKTRLSDSSEANPHP